MPKQLYGLQWDDKFFPHMQHLLELRCFLKGTKKFGGDEDNKPYHFKQVVKHYWGPKSKHPVIWNPWADRMLKAACENDYFFLCGSASCVSGDTRLDDPITGERPTIKELCDKGIAP